jgi:hypothetical protein
MASVRIWQKKQLRLDTLTFKQRDMVTIGSAGLLTVFKRLASAQGPNDGPAMPLKKRYAMYKSRMRKGNRRNLFFTGQMLGSLKLRTVTDNRAYSAPDAKMRTENREARKRAKKGGGAMPKRFTNRDVGLANQKREPWLVFSPINRQAVIAKAREILLAVKNKLIITK